jgi:sec-independent protein translocase protein TatA
MLLFLNDIAGSEVLLILLFVLMFFGAKSIPGLAKTLGRTFRQIREASNDLQSEIKKTTGEMTSNLNLNAILKETEEELRQPLDQVSIELENAIKYEPSSLKTLPENEQVEVTAEYETNELSTEETSAEKKESSPNQDTHTPSKNERL